MFRLGIAFRRWIAYKMKSDPFWQDGAEVVFSGTKMRKGIMAMVVMVVLMTMMMIDMSLMLMIVVVMVLKEMMAIMNIVIAWWF